MCTWNDISQLFTTVEVNSTWQDNISLCRAQFSALPSDPDNCGTVPHLMYQLSAITYTLQLALMVRIL